MLVFAALLYSSTVSRAPVVPPRPIPARATLPLSPVSSERIQRCRATMRLGTGANARTYTTTFTTISKLGCADIPEHVSGYVVQPEPH